MQMMCTKKVKKHSLDSIKPAFSFRLHLLLLSPEFNALTVLNFASYHCSSFKGCYCSACTTSYKYSVAIVQALGVRIAPSSS
jgi:hypothetical protein